MDYLERYKLWCEKVEDKEVKKLLDGMRGDNKAIENAFYKELGFGTGGLRGELGAGTNCLNVYTIAKVTQGIADCMKGHGYKTVAISHDSRINSDVFAKRTAEVFAANGIKAYIVKELMPTPFLSFAVRNTKADIGVMITASHNPAKYNGYKVYNNEGCQLTDKAANEMIGFINKINPFDVKTESFDNYIKAGKIEILSDEVEAAYLAEVQKRSLGSAEGISVAFSPLNGAGYRLVPQILKQSGVKDIYIVKEQGYPDGNFVTCPYPNPEKAAALELGLELSKQKNVDILIATDPDADRVGIAVKCGKEYKLLTGNEVGVLLTDYIFAEMNERKILPQNPVLVKTIVTSSLGVKIAVEYDAEIFEVLTGFKYIGEVIGKLEKQGQQERFIFGYEESYGYLSGTYVRDKDSVVASMLIAEMTAYYKKQGKTLCDRIAEIYKKYGKYEHKLITYEFPGAEGNAKMQQLLESLRNKPLKFVGKKPVVTTIDYLTQTALDLPKSNVLSYNAADGTQIIIRPSGTEPLIKMYLTACNTDEENAKDLKDMTEQLNAIFG